MVKFILDISFVVNYVENFYSDNHCGKILDKALPSFMIGDPMLMVTVEIIKQAKELYPERILVLDTLFGMCHIIDVKGKDKIDTLIKSCAISEVWDKETHVLADDSFIIDAINKTTHRAISIETAKEILKIN